MALQLPLGEPEAGPWRAEPLSTVIEALTRPVPGGAVRGSPVVLAVDGRSNAGKTTLAARIGGAVPGSAVVHTDDIARIGKPNEAPTLVHHREWMAEEILFNAAQRTWQRADVIVCGTPQVPYDPVTEIVVAPPFRPAS
jgi:hypothetical protein